MGMLILIKLIKLKNSLNSCCINPGGLILEY